MVCIYKYTNTQKSPSDFSDFRSYDVTPQHDILDIHRKLLDLTWGSFKIDLTLMTNIAPASLASINFRVQRVQFTKGKLNHRAKYPPGNDHISHLFPPWKRKIIDSKVPWEVILVSSQEGNRYVVLHKNGRHQLNNFNLTRKLHENGWHRMIYNNKVQGGPLTVIDGAWWSYNPYEWPYKI